MISPVAEIVRPVGSAVSDVGNAGRFRARFVVSPVAAPAAGATAGRSSPRGSRYRDGQDGGPA